MAEAAAGQDGGNGRAELMAAVLDAFSERLLAAGSYDRFARCYRRFYRALPHVTRSIHQQFVAQLRDHVTAEIRDVKQEGNLEQLLRELDRIVEESRGCDQPAWRPSGIPDSDARSSLVPFLLKQRSFLRRALSDAQRENRAAAAAVTDGRERIEELRREIGERNRAWKALSAEQQQLTAVLQPRP